MLEKKLRELPDDQVNVLFAKWPNCWKAAAQWWSWKIRWYTLKLVVVPLAPVTFQKAAHNETCPSSIMLKRQIINTKGNVGAAVNQVTTYELASFESNKRLKTNMHTFNANHNTLMLISYRLSYFLLPCVYVFFTLGHGGAKWTPPSLQNKL